MCSAPVMRQTDHRVTADWPGQGLILMKITNRTPTQGTARNPGKTPDKSSPVSYSKHAMPGTCNSLALPGWSLAMATLGADKDHLRLHSLWREMFLMNRQCRSILPVQIMRETPAIKGTNNFGTVETAHRYTTPSGSLSKSRSFCSHAVAMMTCTT